MAEPTTIPRMFSMPSMTRAVRCGTKSCSDSVVMPYTTRKTNIGQQRRFGHRVALARNPRTVKAIKCIPNLPQGKIGTA